MSCEFCNSNKEGKAWEIKLYEATSYKYSGKKYLLEVEYPADGKPYHYVKPIEVNYCPKCGRQLKEKNNESKNF